MSATQKAETGALTVCVRLRSEAAPLRGASVSIYEAGTDLKESPLARFKTDISGKTPQISLPAPDVELALSPTPERMPYSRYDVVAEAPQMEPCVIKGAQIFANTLCIQTIDLFPLKRSWYAAAKHGEEPFGGAYELIETAPHSLWKGFATAAQEGGAPKRSPHVPEYTIVHDGLPDDAGAPDYWLPYREYIKIAASQAVCPLWHENAIRAGVLAIVSLTLARACAKPYEPEIFTLTSSPAHDLPFSYGRCVYGNIATIADEVFNNYIASPYSELPLNAGISDGFLMKNGRALPLWEAQKFAGEGCSSLEILKCFFGDEIYLETAHVAPRGIRALQTQPYPGRALGKDNESPAPYVKIAQKLINAASCAYPEIRGVKADGIFGKRTKEAVEAFQKIFFLADDGLIGKATWYRLWEIGGWRLGVRG